MKKLISIRIDEQLAERAKNIVYWTPGISLSGVIEELLENFVEAVEGGNPMPKREGTLKKGNIKIKV